MIQEMLAKKRKAAAAEMLTTADQVKDDEDLAKIKEHLEMQQRQQEMLERAKEKSRDAETKKMIEEHLEKQMQFRDERQRRQERALNNEMELEVC